MSKIQELFIEVVDNVQASHELFGVPARQVSTLDVGTSFAKDFCDWYFPNREDKSEVADVQMYLYWFREAEKRLREMEEQALKYDEKFNEKKV